MAAEIEALKVTVDETSNDYTVLRSAFEIKQSEWTKVEHAKSASADKKQTKLKKGVASVPSQNRFIPLIDENEEATSTMLNKKLSLETKEPVQDLLNNKN